MFKQYKEILNECEKFAKTEIGPHFLESDLSPNVEWMRSLWQKAHGLDLPGLLIPQQFGGAGEPELCAALILDVFAGDCAGVASLFVHHFAACQAILADDPAKRERSFSSITAKGGTNGLATIIFANDGSDISLEEKNGKIYISGQSGLVGNAELAELLCVFAQEGDQEEHITCVLVSRDARGISLGENASLPGLKANAFAPVIFQDAEILSDAIIGARGQAKRLMETVQQTFLGFVAAMAMGTARKAYEMALTYAKNRYQFGKVIIRHQEIQRMLGSMRMKLEIGTAGYLSLFNPEKPNLPYASLDPSLAKAFCADAAQEIIIDAIQIHGGYGYMHEYGLEKRMRDAKILQLICGSTPKHHIAAIAGEIKKRP